MHIFHNECEVVRILFLESLQRQHDIQIRVRHLVTLHVHGTDVLHPNDAGFGVKPHIFLQTPIKPDGKFIQKLIVAGTVFFVL